MFDAKWNLKFCFIFCNGAILIFKLNCLPLPYLKDFYFLWVTIKLMSLLKDSCETKRWPELSTFQSQGRRRILLSLQSHSLHHACSAHPVHICGVKSVFFPGRQWVVLRVSYYATGERSPFSCGEWVTPPTLVMKEDTWISLSETEG